MNANIVRNEYHRNQMKSRKQLSFLYKITERLQWTSYKSLFGVPSTFKSVSESEAQTI